MRKYLTRRRTRHDETGATAVEYGLMVALIAAVIITATVAIGSATSDIFANYVAAWIAAM